jgi:hypothetical protein
MKKAFLPVPATPHEQIFVSYLCDGADDCDGLPGLGPEPDGRARLRSFRLRFSASICLFFFLTEGFS